jgi:cytoskeletal protein CcmA (bactofilin family)
MFKRPDEVKRSDPAPISTQDRSSPEPRTSANVSATNVASIGSTIHVKGDITGDENLVIDGTVEGTITLKEYNLHVGKNGRLKADVFAKSIRIEGRVEGNLQAEEQVLLRASGVVRGNISSPRLTMEDGCSFKGSVDMEPKGERKAIEFDRKAGHPHDQEPQPSMGKAPNVGMARSS